LLSAFSALARYHAGLTPGILPVALWAIGCTDVRLIELQRAEALRWREGYSKHRRFWHLAALASLTNRQDAAL